MNAKKKEYRYRNRLLMKDIIRVQRQIIRNIMIKELEQMKKEDLIRMSIESGINELKLN